MLLAGDRSAEHLNTPNFGHRLVTTLEVVFERTTPPHFSRPPEDEGSILRATTGNGKTGRCHVMLYFSLRPVEPSGTCRRGDVAIRSIVKDCRGDLREDAACR